MGWLVVFLLLISAGTRVFAAPLSWNSREFMGIDELRPGMTGYGKTVYQGMKVETFGVQVLGVLKKVDFGFDMILIRVTSGPVVTRKLQTVSGMSGSPIYINNRLIGAYAYGWDFQQEPIAGVTPIAAMLECTQPGSTTPAPKTTGTLIPANKTLTIGNTLITRVKVASTHSDAAQMQAKADPTTMVLTPVSTPLFVSGMSDAAMPALESIFGRYNLRAMAGPGQMPGPATKLEPGSAVAVSLMEGDANLSAIGTVTYVKGDTVLAFGHPFMGTGKTNLPMSTAYVHNIINSSQSSFKMASPVARVGTLTSDRQYAVGGVLGEKPNVLPVTMHLTDASRKFDRSYRVDLVHDPAFTSYLLYLYVLSNGAGQMADVEAAEGTFTAHTTISTESLGNLEQHMIVSPMAASMMPMIEFFFLADSLMVNPYEPVKITGAKIDIQYQPERNIAVIEKVTPDRPVARPGETVKLNVRIRPYGKPVETRTVTVKVPPYANEPAMMVLVAGGSHGMMLKQMFFPAPAPEEGVRGIIRWLTDIPSGQSLITAQVMPSPSYAYRGQLLNDVPTPLVDLLRFGDAGSAMPQGGSANNSSESEEEASTSSSGGAGTRPAVYLSSEDARYLLSGGQMVTIAIDSPESRSSPDKSMNMAAQLPVLSSSIPIKSSDSDSENTGAESDSASSYENALNWYQHLSWQTPQQQARIAALFTALRMPSAQTSTGWGVFPLKTVQTGINHFTTRAEGDAPADGPDAAAPAGADGGDAVSDAPEATEEEGTEEASEPADTTLLTGTHPSWGITGRNDFLRGSHFGTAVTSKGTLALMPAVRTLYQTNDMLPWRMVATQHGVYVAGWNTEKILRLTDDGKDAVFFPKDAADGGKAQAVTALAADADGNILAAVWPGQRVLLLSPEGARLREWTLPGVNNIWDLAIASDGKRYAACDQGILYLLRDDQQVPLKVVAYVPDKGVYALAPGPAGTMYLATTPRGKIYRIAADGTLEAVYEAKTLVTAMTVDAQDNVYIGTSPRCYVYRIAPDGTRTRIMTGAAHGNQHVFALKMVGDDLYAATGPAGGIYRISKPTEQQPDVTAIYAREDLRTGADENAATGPESVMVTALAVTPQGAVLAAASTPGQVLKLEPRTEGVFVSSVLPAPTAARWGQLEIQGTRTGDNSASVRVETRSGRTGWPDTTWSAWQELGKEQLIASPQATYAQIRVTVHDTATGRVAVDYIRAHYQQANQAPTVKLQAPKVGVFWSGKQDVSWEGKDPDEDSLVYMAAVSPDSGRRWLPLTLKPSDETAKTEEKKDADAGEKPAAPEQKPADPTTLETSESTFSWDTATLPNGTYRLRIVASDKYAKPTDAKTAEDISGIFTVDNTPPTISLDEKMTGWDSVKRFTVTDNLVPLVGGKYRVDNGPWIALVPEDGIFDSREENVLLVSPNGPLPLADAEHKLEIITKDAAGNELSRTITLVIGTPAPAAAK